MNNLEINREIVLSTAHITKATSKVLDLTNAIDYGYRICTDDNNMSLLPDLNPLLELARANDCKWLILDCDGPIVDNLKTWEW